MVRNLMRRKRIPCKLGPPARAGAVQLEYDTASAPSVSETSSRVPPATAVETRRRAASLSYAGTRVGLQKTGPPPPRTLPALSPGLPLPRRGRAPLTPVTQRLILMKCCSGRGLQQKYSSGRGPSRRSRGWLAHAAGPQRQGARRANPGAAGAVPCIPYVWDGLCEAVDVTGKQTTKRGCATARRNCARRRVCVWGGGFEPAIRSGERGASRADFLGPGTNCN